MPAKSKQNYYPKDKSQPCYGYKARVVKGVIEASKCTNYSVKGSITCAYHEYYESFTEEQFQQIDLLIAGKGGKMSLCGRCKRFVDFDTADIVGRCQACRQKAKAIQDKTKRCKWVVWDRSPCINTVPGDKQYCDTHSYVADYTEQMVADSVLCGYCKKIAYCGDKYKSCIQCRHKGRTKESAVGRSRRLELADRVAEDGEDSGEDSEEEAKIEAALRTTCGGYIGKVSGKDTLTISKCTGSSIEDSGYCWHHSYYQEKGEKFRMTVKHWFEGINNKKLTFCKRCRRFGSYDGIDVVSRCKPCKEAGNAHGKMLTAKKKKKCKWFDRHMNPCRADGSDESDYCKFHQYVEGYTEEMKKDRIKCSRCLKIIPFPVSIWNNFMTRLSTNGLYQASLELNS